MLKGTIIENSLGNKDILKTIQIVKNWAEDDWVLYSVLIDEKRIPELAKSLKKEPWYIHLWEPGKDDVIVIFPNKVFILKFSDKSTWADTVAYGKSIGIPKHQLDFPID